MSETNRQTCEGLAPEELRLPVERDAARALRLDPVVRRIALERRPADHEAVRRDLVAGALRLSEAMAPEIHRLLGDIKRVLQVHNGVEIYQAAGFDNAGAAWAAEDPVLIIVQGELLTKLDEGSLRVALGHELGHFLAHGPAWPQSDMGFAARIVQLEMPVPHLLGLTAALGMGMELTADRFGLLAAQDLEAALKAQMVTASGLPLSAVGWSSEAYLDQCKTLMEETLARGEAAVGDTHPEHNLRSYASWLFSESDVYKDLTGKGPGSRPLGEVDETLSMLILPPKKKKATKKARFAGSTGSRPGPNRPRGESGPIREAKGESPQSVGEVIGTVSGAVSRASGKIKDVAAQGVAAALDRRGFGAGRNSPSEVSEGAAGIDPLAEDEEALLDKFAALERRQTASREQSKRSAKAADPLADDEQELLDKFAALESRFKDG